MASTSATALIQQASVINGYAQVLEAAQRQARRAIERARDADERIKEAKADIEQAVDDQGTAQARILAAQIAQSRIFSNVVDLLSGAGAAAPGGAGCRRARRGGPANPAFAAAAGITLPKPPEPEEDDRSWLERRFDDVGNAASWTWDQAKQVPGGAWEGVTGIYEGGKFILQLNPTNAMNWRDPGAMIDRYRQVGEAGVFAWNNPGEFGKALINYEDLEAGRYGEWAGNLLPDAILAVATGGAGAAATRGTRIVGATDKLADAARAYDRAADVQRRMPLKDFREDKTIAAQPGDRGGISISGEQFPAQERVLERIGGDPAL